MKKMKNYLNLSLLCLALIVFAACGDDDKGASIEDRLCRTWMQEYVDADITYTHKLIFKWSGRSGQEIKMSYDSKTATTNTETRDFTWQWRDDSKECLILNYGAGETKLFENVWVREHYLSGILGGQVIMMTDEDYH